MHIEINGGGLGVAGTVNDLYDNLGTFISDSVDILSAFKVVESRTCGLTGGIGNLAGAVEGIGDRIREEEQKIEDAKEALRKTDEFARNTIRTDVHVAEIVNTNKEEFYQMHPWLRPPEPEKDDRNIFQKGWDYLKEGFEEFGEAVVEVFTAIGDTLKKGWDKLVEFYEEHKKIIDTILIVVGAIAAIAAVVSGGGLLVLVPLLTAIGVSAPVAAAISGTVAVVAVVSTIASSSMNVADIWLEIDNPLFNKIQTAMNITAGVSNAMVAVGSLYNAYHPGALDSMKEQMRTEYARGRFDPNGGPATDTVANHFPGSDKGVAGIAPDEHGSFYKVKDAFGNDSYVSRGWIEQDDFVNIVDNAHGEVNIFTGTHGTSSGKLVPEHGFMTDDWMRWRGVENVHVYDITTLSPAHIDAVVSSPGYTNVFAWCNSERSLDVLRALKLM